MALQRLSSRFFTIIIGCAIVGTAVIFASACFHAPKWSDVTTLTLTLTNVPLPSLHEQTDPSRTQGPGPSTRYAILPDWGQYHLYYVAFGRRDRVTGDVPPLEDVFKCTASPYAKYDGTCTLPYVYRAGNFRDADVSSSSGTITYATYTKYRSLFIEGEELVASDVYALQGTKSERIFSGFQPAGINQIDLHISLDGGYVDHKGNLYVLGLDHYLYVIRDGRVIARADIARIGGSRPAIPSMFSDNDNTYFVVPKLFDSENSMGAYGPVAEGEVRAKYAVKL